MLCEAASSPPAHHAHNQVAHLTTNVLCFVFCVLCFVFCVRSSSPKPFPPGGGGGGVLPYMGYIGMCGPKGMVFQSFWS